MLQDPHEVRSIFDERKIAFADATRDERPCEHAGPRPEFKDGPVGRNDVMCHQAGKRIARWRDRGDTARIGDPRPEEMKEVGICANSRHDLDLH
jgi:hypothetical protein